VSTKAIRECLLVLKHDMPVSPLIERMTDTALAELAGIERAAKEACAGSVIHRIAGSDEGGELAALLESIAMDAK
jgi:hypothetical protein